MEQRQRVVLYGHSVVLGAVEASLRRDQRFEVLRLAPSATAQELASLVPDAILFDTDAGCSGPAFAVLRARPGLLLIGVDPASEELLVLSPHTERTFGMADLVKVIRHEGSGSPETEAASE